MKVPIVKAPDASSFLNFGRKRRQVESSFDKDFDEEFAESFKTFPGVNFANILRAAFLYEIFCAPFYVLKV